MQIEFCAKITFFAKKNILKFAELLIKKQELKRKYISYYKYNTYPSQRIDSISKMKKSGDSENQKSQKPYEWVWGV